MKIITVLLSLMFLSLPARFDAQTVENDKIQKSNRSLVSVPVTVSDRDGHYIPGLKKEDFTVFQDGVRQNISFFATYDEPLNIALVLDTSGSTKDVLDNIRDAAVDFINLLNKSDQCLIATFDSQVKILSPFTANRKSLKNSLGDIESAEIGGTLMYSAIDRVLKNSFAKVEGRKVIVLLTDGKDFGSALGKDDLLAQLEESDVLIYTVFYKTGVNLNRTAKQARKEKEKKKKNGTWTPSRRGPVYAPTENEVLLSEKKEELEAVGTLMEMSETTGGRFYRSDEPKLDAVFRRVAGELREQYRIGFHSKDAGDKATHDIVVKVNKPDARVLARGRFRGK